MAYKKPQMVAKSVAKKSYVAGCPTNSGTNITSGSDGTHCYNISCEIWKRN